MIPTDIQLTITSDYLASIAGLAHSSPCEPLVCSGALNPAYSGDLSHLVDKFTNFTLLLDLKVLIAFI